MSNPGVAVSQVKVCNAFKAVIGQDFIEGLELAKSFTHFSPAIVAGFFILGIGAARGLGAATS